METGRCIHTEEETELCEQWTAPVCAHRARTIQSDYMTSGEILVASGDLPQRSVMTQYAYALILLCTFRKRPVLLHHLTLSMLGVSHSAKINVCPFITPPTTSVLQSPNYVSESHIR